MKHPICRKTRKRQNIVYQRAHKEPGGTWRFAVCRPDYLKERIANLEKLVYGPKSEKTEVILPNFESAPL